MDIEEYECICTMYWVDGSSICTQGKKYQIKSICNITYMILNDDYNIKYKMSKSRLLAHFKIAEPIII